MRQAGATMMLIGFCIAVVSAGCSGARSESGVNAKPAAMYADEGAAGQTVATALGDGQTAEAGTFAGNDVEAGSVVIPGYGTATIDGIMSGGEWDGARRIDFQANLPQDEGGGTTPATILVMNDETNLYFALRIERPSFGGATNPVFEFDNDNDCVREDGDDVVGMSVGIYQPAVFFDDYRYTCPGSAPGSAGCGPYDTATLPGFPLPGTFDGAAEATNDGQYTYIEISHPLDSADDLHDFSLGIGDTVGFTLILRLFSLDTSCNFGPACYADTYFPAQGTYCSDPRSAITIASPDVTPAPAGINAGIDIKPGGFPNSINSGSRGKVPVAILSAPGFDAPAVVDVPSLTFGRSGGEESLAFCNQGSEDVNADGLPDLVCHFFTAKTGFLPGDAAGGLKGMTVDGVPFEGWDSVKIVP